MREHFEFELKETSSLNFSVVLQTLSTLLFCSVHIFYPVLFDCAAIFTFCSFSVTFPALEWTDKHYPTVSSPPRKCCKSELNCSFWSLLIKLHWFWAEGQLNKHMTWINLRDSWSSAATDGRHSQWEELCRSKWCRKQAALKWNAPLKASSSTYHHPLHHLTAITSKLLTVQS